MAMRNLFSFDASRETPEMLVERRARAQALAGQIGGATTIGGGIGDIFRGLGAGLSRYRADSAQREGEASGRNAMDEFLDVMDQPQAQPMATPSNDAVRENLKAGISTGTVPPLATYTPPGPQNAGRPDTRPQPSYTPPMPEPEAMAEPVEPRDEGVQQAGYQPAPTQPQNPDRAVMAKMVAILRNPWVPEADKALVRQRYEDLVKKSDPDYQYEQKTKRAKDALEIGKSKIELHNLQNPDRPMQGWTDPNTGDLYAYEPHDPAGTKVLVQKAGPKASASEAKIVPKGARIYENGQWIDPPVIEGATAADPDVEEALKIAKSYEGQAGFTGASQVAPLMRDMIKSIDNPSAMADLTFVNGLAKILDPTSVVREAEGKMVIESQGMAPALVGYLNKAINGEQGLTSKVRADLVKVAMGRAKEWRDQAARERKHFESVMRATSHNPDVFLQQAPTFPHYGDTQNMQRPMIPAPRNPPKPPGVEKWVIDPVTKKPKRVQ